MNINISKLFKILKLSILLSSILSLCITERVHAKASFDLYDNTVYDHTLHFEEETVPADTEAIEEISGTANVNTSVTVLNNGAFQFSVDITNTNPLVLIKGISGTVTFNDITAGTSVSYSVYSTQFVPYSQFHFYRNYSTGFTAGHYIQVYFSYHVMVFQGELTQTDFWGRIYVTSA